MGSSNDTIITNNDPSTDKNQHRIDPEDHNGKHTGHAVSARMKRLEEDLCRALTSHSSSRQVLVSMGLRLRWDERDQIGRVTEPEEDSEAKKNKAKEEEEEEEGSTILRYLKDLERRAQQVSERYLVSSLLAGPDNESDEALDVPVLLGSFPAGATLPSGGTDWVLQKLGLEHTTAAQASSAMVTVLSAHIYIPFFDFMRPHTLI
jgi:hypothetical protein